MMRSGQCYLLPWNDVGLVGGAFVRFRSWPVPFLGLNGVVESELHFERRFQDE